MDTPKKAEATEVKNVKTTKADKAKVATNTSRSGYIKSKVNQDVIIKYNGRDMIVPPRAKVRIPDFKLLGKFNPAQVLKIED